MLLDEPARRSDVEASAELAVEDPLPNDKTALMRAAARGDVAEARRHLDERGERRQWQDCVYDCCEEGSQGSGRGPS